MNMSSMTELIVDQHNTDTLSTTNNNHQLFSESFLIKVSQYIKISNTVRADVRTDIVYMSIVQTQMTFLFLV
jgi:hypothetical protein